MYALKSSSFYFLCFQWWSDQAVLKQEFFIKGGFAKDIHFSEDFKTFVMVDNTSTLYILKQVQ
jgi:hypothetical protein